MKATIVSVAAILALACGLAAQSTASAGRRQGLGDRLHRRAVKDLASGKLLISARDLADPNFAKTVVLLAEFSAEGAVGFIVNRPASVTLARLFPRFAASPGGAMDAFVGGPVVAPGAVAALIRSTSAAEGGRRIVGDVYLVRSREQLEKAIASGFDANRVRVYLGYAGWGPGQLDAETAGGAWHVVDGDAGVVFDPHPEAVWQRQIRRTEALSASASPRVGLLAQARRNHAQAFAMNERFERAVVLE
jgi:putative transcriptional regulator